MMTKMPMATPLRLPSLTFSLCHSYVLVYPTFWDKPPPSHKKRAHPGRDLPTWMGSYTTNSVPFLNLNLNFFSVSIVTLSTIECQRAGSKQWMPCIYRRFGKFGNNTVDSKRLIAQLLGFHNLPCGRWWVEFSAYVS